MSKDPTTIGVYDARATEYATVTAAPTPGRLLQDFMDSVPPGGRILDLGCGPGISAGWMAKSGFTVEATDASAQMIELASKIPNVCAKLASFDDLRATNRYDGVWANFSLLHAPRSDMPRHLSAIHRALRSEGAFHLAVKTGIGSARDRLGRFYTYYTPQELSALLNDAGFTITKITPGRDKGLDGTLSDWISVATHA